MQNAQRAWDAALSGGGADTALDRLACACGCHAGCDQAEYASIDQRIKIEAHPSEMKPCIQGVRKRSAEMYRQHL